MIKEVKQEINYLYELKEYAAKFYSKAEVLKVKKAINTNEYFLTMLTDTPIGIKVVSTRDGSSNYVRISFVGRLMSMMGFNMAFDRLEYEISLQNLSVERRVYKRDAQEALERI